MTSSSAVVDRLHHLDALVSDKDEYDEEENYQPQPPPPPPPDHNHITPLPESTTTPPSSLSPTTTNYFPSDRWSQAEERFLEVFFGKDQVSRFSKRIRSRRLKVGSAGRVVKFDIALQKPIPSKFHTEQQKRRPSSSSSNSTFSTATASLRPSEPYAKIIRPRTANLTKRQRKTLTRFRELDKIVFIRPSSASGLSRGAVAAEGGDGQESSRSPSTSDIDDDASPRRKQSSQHQLQLPPSPTRRNHLFTAKSADGSLKFRPWSGSSNRWMNLGTRVSTSAGKQRNFPIFALPRNVR